MCQEFYWLLQGLASLLPHGFPFPPLFLTKEVLEQLGIHVEEEVDFQLGILLLFG